MRKLLTAFFGDPRRGGTGGGAGLQAGRRQLRVRLGRSRPPDFKNNFDAGWNGTIGVTFNINEHLGIQAEYIYARMNGPEKTIIVSPTPVAGPRSNQLIESNHQMHVGSFNLVYQGHQAAISAVGGYVLGGAGIYHRIVQLTSPSVGYTTFCDPYWYVCYPAAVSVDKIIGDRSSNDFGIDIGGGITFGHEAKFYVEIALSLRVGQDHHADRDELPAGRRRRRARADAARTRRTSR